MPDLTLAIQTYSITFINFNHNEPAGAGKTDSLERQEEQ